MHLDGVGNGFQIERAQMRYALREKAILLANDFGRHLQDRPRPLIERPHQPRRILQAVGEVGFVAVLADGFGQLRIVNLIDQNFRQSVAVELDMPAAVGTGTDINIRHHALGLGRSELQAGLWIEVTDFADHVGDVIIIDAADFS
ncbi:Uncharacterised protein [Mycobacterium tuberculosis]|nr:Uncharacterised protein [Mycobacterium tuberculosis]